MMESPYGITCELGEIETTAHKLTGISPNDYDSGSVFFEKTASREKFKSNRFMELALDFGTDTSNRNAANRLNRIRLELDGISPTTYRNTVEREGQKIQKRIEEKCENALLSHGFNTDGEQPQDVPFKSDPAKHMSQEDIESAAAKLNIKKYNISDYELPEETTNVSIDDVCVKRQTETRPKKEDTDQAKRVNNTVIHVQHNKKRYILNAASLHGALKLLIGFLLFNGISRHQIVVFADGARDIHSAVLKMLGFLNYKIILDWYHLCKKCREQLSMALKNSKIRNDFIKELFPCLWFGNVNGAVKLLRDIDSKKVKNHEIITKLIEYFERVRNYIPCYALRKELGLRNSSNLGEKANDTIVANRQKHNGMSWSSHGSVAFASVASASHNGEIIQWLHNHDLSFNLLDFAA